MIAAGKREVILKENKDRIAIIDAIQGASTNELKALAEIKDAILSGRGSITQLGENQGKVSQRLSRRRIASEPYVSGDAKNTQANPYIKRLPMKKRGGRRSTTEKNVSLLQPTHQSAFILRHHASPPKS
ncbi:hypothetical protein HTZ85_26145 [Escherichia coli]|nr:hypothetical protein [Escherichia coli]